jgi:EAL domain-containing protein (putative c-di-GMP-specific phosphodiesterase class I)
MLPLSVNVSSTVAASRSREEMQALLALSYRTGHAGAGTHRKPSDRRPAGDDFLLRPLREAGVRIALDDFGMGYAGLHQLQHIKSLPVDILKIDKVFIDMLPDDVSMVPAIIQLARG